MPTYNFLPLQDNEKVIDAATKYSNLMLFCAEKDYSYDPYFFATKKILGQNKEALELVNSGPFCFKQRMAAFRFKFMDGKTETNFFYFIFAKIESGIML